MKPYDCGRADLLMSRMGATTDSCRVQEPKSSRGTLNSMSDTVSWALNVNRTGLVWGGVGSSDKGDLIKGRRGEG